MFILSLSLNEEKRAKTYHPCLPAHRGNMKFTSRHMGFCTGFSHHTVLIFRAVHSKCDLPIVGNMWRNSNQGQRKPETIALSSRK